MTLTLTIDTGNDAVQTGDDLAAILEREAENLRMNIGPYNVDETVTNEGSKSYPIRDVNGNTVGRWEIQ